MGERQKGGLRTKGFLKNSKQDEPLITIITVVFNNAKTLEQTILSVVNQTYKNFEYVVIDGGSTDGTLDIIKKYEEEIDYWMSEKDNGIYDAMNKGIKLAKGDWVHILNSDDYYLDENVLEKAAAHLKNPDKNFYYFTMLQDFSGTKKVYKYSYNYFKLFYSAYLPHPTLLVSALQYKELGLYDTRYRIAADHDMILRLCKNFKPNFIDMPLTVMSTEGCSSKNMEFNFKEFRDVTVKNGFNYFFAELFYLIKIFRYKLVIRRRLSKLRQ